MFFKILNFFGNSIGDEGFVVCNFGDIYVCYLGMCSCLYNIDGVLVNYWFG